MDANENGTRFHQDWKREGNLIWPLLIDNCTTDMKINWEEPFRPVIPITRMKTPEEDIVHCSATKVELQMCGSRIAEVRHVCGAMRSSGSSVMHRQSTEGGAGSLELRNVVFDKPCSFQKVLF